MKNYILYFKRLIFTGVVVIFSAITLYANFDSQVIFWHGGKVPDPALRSYLLNKYDKNGNEKISKTEWIKVDDLDIAEMGIKSLEGYPLKDLRILNCRGNRLTSLDLSIRATQRLLNISRNHDNTTLLRVVSKKH